MRKKSKIDLPFIGAILLGILVLALVVPRILPDELNPFILDAMYVTEENRDNLITAYEYTEPNINSEELPPDDYTYETEEATPVTEMSNEDIPFYPQETPDITPQETPNPIRFIYRRMGLFAEKGDIDVIGVIEPQLVNVLQNDGDWFEIETSQGNRWIYDNFTPPIHDLIYLFEQHGEIGVFYMNINTGFTIEHNADMVFFGASMTKAKQALYMYTLAERNMISMNTRHIYDAEIHWRGGTGIIQNSETGTEFTTRSLLYHSIIHSCNVAFGMLWNYAADADMTYHQFRTELGLRYFPGNLRSHINSSAADTGMWMYAIYNYIESDGVYAHLLRRDLINSPQFIEARYPIASKYGWASTFNDGGIILAPSPYILVIKTNKSEGARGLMREISQEIQRFNTMWFAP